MSTYIPPGSAPPPEPDRPMARAPEAAAPCTPSCDNLDDELEELEDAAAQEPSSLDIATPLQEGAAPAVVGMMLAADRTQISRIVHALFCNLDPFGYVSLRAFRQFPPKGERDRPLHIEAIRLNLGLEPVIDRAVVIATRIANGGEPAVFAPPICTFTSRTGAKSSDVHEAPVLSVEIDQGNLDQIADRLSLILSDRPTISLHSGSLWADPETGEILPKGHLHWRLRTPARGPEQQRMLRRARDIATLIAGGDPSGTPPVHPLRFPGTWNRKTEPPVMARIFEENANTTIDLAEALAVLEDAAHAADLATPRSAPHLAADDLPAELAQLAEWLRVYTTDCLRAPNQGLWHDWNKVAMATHRATGGSEAGYQLFRAWSETSRHYNEANCRARWYAITSCPATWIGARFLRRMAIEHGWTEPEPELDQEQQPHTWDSDTGPDGTDIPEPRLDEPAQLPVILCEAGHLDRMYRETEAALLAARRADLPAQHPGEAHRGRIRRCSAKWFNRPTKNPFDRADRRHRTSADQAAVAGGDLHEVRRPQEGDTWCAIRRPSWWTSSSPHAATGPFRWCAAC